MKIYAYILIVLSGVLTAQCSKVTLDEICGYPSAPGGGNGEGEGNGDYNSYWYYCNLQIFLCLFLEKLNMPQNTPVTKAS